jgi:hypothetical protein
MAEFEQTLDRAPNQKTPEQKAEAAKIAAAEGMEAFSQHGDQKIAEKAGDLKVKLEGVPAGDSAIEGVNKTLSKLGGDNARVSAQERLTTNKLLQGDLPMQA